MYFIIDNTKDSKQVLESFKTVEEALIVATSRIFSENLNKEDLVVGNQHYVNEWREKYERKD